MSCVCTIIIINTDSVIHNTYSVLSTPASIIHRTGIKSTQICGLTGVRLQSAVPSVSMRGELRDQG